MIENQVPPEVFKSLAGDDSVVLRNGEWWILRYSRTVDRPIVQRKFVCRAYQFNLGDDRQAEEYNDLLDKIARYGKITFEDFKYDEDIKSWKTLLRVIWNVVESVLPANAEGLVDEQVQ